ncbi:MAG: methyltransferase type 11 [Solirubrobacterales bacterium 70-9]|nr:MAG: methyltransferase type 11 [Solirubrobacterales bacterium 70-9]
MPEKVHHPLFARLYMRMTSGRKAHGEDEHRLRLLAGLSGEVIEVGAGNGLNFPLYPETVTRVIAVEPEPRLRQAAIAAAADAPVPVEVVAGVAGDLPPADESFDAGVASLVLCSVSDQSQALAELRRVIRPGGELRFYEHVVAHKPWVRRMQRAADATFWPHVGGGCHLSRDTGAAIERGGFRIESQKRFPFTPGPPVPPIPHILGVAKRP